MNVLHLGWGFSPWRGGGLIEYAEDLMEIQAKNGFNVYYFCSGRHYPFFNKIKLLKRKRNNINIFEVINPPIYHGGDRGSSQPDLDQTEPLLESFFRKVLDETGPDIIHIQELAGLPSSLIDIVKDEYKIPVLMTLHDYFLLCPTLKLIDYNQCFCYHDNLDYACAVCCQNAHTNKNNLIKSTISYHLNRNSVLHRIVPLMVKFKNSIKRTETAPIPALKSNAEYQKRRNVNLSRMDKIDLLVAQSHKVEAIYRCFLKNKKIITLHSTVSHLSSIEPKKMEKLTGKVSFCTLNGFASIPKGSLILKKALDLLNERGLKDQFHFHIWGGLDPEFETVKDWENVTYHGTYQVDDLNQNLELIEVGVVPSIWEEIYGYVGLEFLAKGIPVIGNNKGGIIDYTIKNFTGWINKSSSPEELANIMELIITDPSLINKLNKKIVENRWNLIKNMNDHFEEIKAIYSSLIN